MADPRSNAIPVRNHILTHEVTDTDEVVVYDAQARQLLVLNHVAAGVWLLIDGKRSVADLVNEVLENMEADADTVHADVVSFLDSLNERELVQWTHP